MTTPELRDDLSDKQVCLANALSDGMWCSLWDAYFDDVDINATITTDGRSLLSIGGRHRKASKLLMREADVNHRDREGRTPISSALPALVPRYLELGADVDARDNDGRTPLMYAVVDRDEALLRALLEAGANAKLASQGNTALSLAAMAGDWDAIKALLDARADEDLSYESRQALLQKVPESSRCDKINRALLSHDISRDPERTPSQDDEQTTLDWPVLQLDCWATFLENTIALGYTPCFIHGHYKGRWTKPGIPNPQTVLMATFRESEPSEEEANSLYDEFTTLSNSPGVTKEEHDADPEVTILILRNGGSSMRMVVSLPRVNSDISTTLNSLGTVRPHRRVTYLNITWDDYDKWFEPWYDDPKFNHYIIDLVCLNDAVARSATSEGDRIYVPNTSFNPNFSIVFIVNNMPGGAGSAKIVVAYSEELIYFCERLR